MPKVRPKKTIPALFKLKGFTMHKEIELTQCVFFDLCDLIQNNPNLLNKKIKGLEEFDTLGDFLHYQKSVMTTLEQRLTHE